MQYINNHFFIVLLICVDYDYLTSTKKLF